jgi:hypothetical protein
MRRAIRVVTVATLALAAGAGFARAAPARPADQGILTPRLGFLVPDSRGTPLRWTRDDGATWKPITVTAGPYTVGG